MIAREKRPFIVLGEDSYLSKSGSKRKLYRYPDNSKKCIKVTKPDVAWHRKLFKYHIFNNDNIRDAIEYRDIAKHNKPVFQHVARYFGLVNTNLGDGMVVEYLDGIVDIKAFIEEHGVSDELLDTMSKAFKTIIAQNVMVRDIRSLPNTVLHGKVGEDLNLYFLELGLKWYVVHHIYVFRRWGVSNRLKKLLRSLTKTFPEHSHHFILDDILLRP